MKIKELEKEEGYELGLEFAGLFKENIKDFKKAEVYLCDQEKFKIVKNNINKVYPEYLEEMYGRADGLGINRDDFLIEMCFSGFTSKEACTDIVVKVSDNEIVSGHNEDLSETIEEAALIKYKKDEMFYFDFSTWNCPQGTTFGWNSNGIVISVNTIHTFEYHQQGVPAWFILRDIVFSRSIEEIEKKIEKVYCTTGFSLNVVDKNLYKAYSIEKIYDNLDIIEITDKYVHTNHIIHPKTKYSSKLLGCTTIRWTQANRKLQDLKNKQCTMKEIKDILQFYHDPSQYIYRPIKKDEDCCTIATFVFNSKTNEISIYSYYDKSLIKSDYYTIKQISEFDE